MTTERYPVSQDVKKGDTVRVLKSSLDPFYWGLVGKVTQLKPKRHQVVIDNRLIFDIDDIALEGKRI